MSTPLAPYADAERLLVAALVPFGETGTVLPAGLADLPLFVRVERIGGADDRVTDAARCDVEVYAPTRGAAWDAARTIQQYLIAGPRRVPGVGIIDRIGTEVGPQEMPYDDQRVRKVSATYEVASRRSAP